MEIPVQLKHATRLLLLIVLLAEGTNQISPNLRKLNKPKPAIVSNPVQTTLALKTEPRNRWEPLVMGPGGVFALIVNHDLTADIDGVGALASADYIHDYLRRQALPSIWQQGLVYLAEPRSSTTGMAILMRAAYDEAGVFALADGNTQDPGVWPGGSADGSWSASRSSNNSGSGSGSGSGMGAQSSGGGASPQAGAPVAAAVGAKNTPATALGNGVVHAQPGSALVPLAISNVFTMQTSAATAISGGLNYSPAATNNAGRGSVFANYSPWYSGGFLFDLRAMMGGARTTPQLWAAASPVRPVMWDQRLDNEFHLSAITSNNDPPGGDDPFAALTTDILSNNPVSSDAPAEAPEPGTWLLSIAGLAGIAVLRRRTRLGFDCKLHRTSEALSK